MNTDAKNALQAWTAENISLEHRSALSKLVAAFVVEAVRNDRAKQAADEALRVKARDAVRKVRDMNSPFGGDTFTDNIDAMFRGINGMPRP